MILHISYLYFFNY